MAVLLGVYLAKLGLGLVQIGLFFSAGLAGSTLFTFLVSLITVRLGYRRLLIGFALMTAMTGLALILTDNVVVLTLFAALGSLSGEGRGRAGPTQALEQAGLAGAAPDDRRTELYAWYRIVSYAAAAVGALAAAFPALLRDAWGVAEATGYRTMFAGFVGCLFLAALLYSRLSPKMEDHLPRGGWSNPLRLPSRRIIFTLTALFSLDAFAGSLVVESLVAYWFNTRFGLELSALGLVFFASQVLAAISLWLATHLARRIGLLNTMVFTHIPSSLFLIAAAFAPVGWMAVLFWQLRSFLGQMDVPTRDSYTMAVVGPEERVAMASIHLVGRSVTGMTGPSVATALWQALAASVPFVACGVLKIIYDLSLYFLFRRVKPPEEVAREQQRASGRGKGRAVG